MEKKHDYSCVLVYLFLVALVGVSQHKDPTTMKRTPEILFFMTLK